MYLSYQRAYTHTQIHIYITHKECKEPFPHLHKFRLKVTNDEQTLSVYFESWSVNVIKESVHDEVEVYKSTRTKYKDFPIHNKSISTVQCHLYIDLSFKNNLKPCIK